MSASDIILLVLIIIELFQEKYRSITGLDGKTQLEMLAFKSSRIRLLRSMAIQNHTMQVLLLILFEYDCFCLMIVFWGIMSVQVFDFAGFMEPEFDTPIFCANFFTSANMNIVVL